MRFRLIINLLLVGVLAAANGSQASDGFCLQHIQGGSVLRNCVWNQEALRTATCVHRGEGETGEVKTIKYTELKNWKEVPFGEVGCTESEGDRQRRIRGDEGSDG